MVLIWTDPLPFPVQRTIACPRCKSAEVTLWFKTQVSYKLRTRGDGRLIAFDRWAGTGEMDHSPEWHCSGCDMDWDADGLDDLDIEYA